jgi:CubicO group peptidase (beta-lactamase class C family)
MELRVREQDRRFARAFSILEAARRDRAFPATSVAVLHRREVIALKALGRYTFDPGSALVTSTTLFDIASVSKVVATTTAAAILAERGQLDLDSRVPSRPELSVRALLTHTSGLPAYIRLFEQARDRRELLSLAYGTNLEAAPGARTEYSDIGFIILGDLIEQIAGESLDRFCSREIFQPLGMKDTCFTPPGSLRSRIAPTADDRHFRHKLIQGEVHDENAWVMNGVAGHAGLFSTAYDLALFADCWLLGGSPILREKTIGEFTRQQPGTQRALGWDRPTPPSSSGQYFSPASFGHLGFTGTSLWCDPERQLAIVLLTNRVWPDSANQAIKQVRPRFHDAVVEAL